jgi:hypothetical protein
MIKAAREGTEEKKWRERGRRKERRKPRGRSRELTMSPAGGGWARLANSAAAGAPHSRPGAAAGGGIPAEPKPCSPPSSSCSGAVIFPRGGAREGEGGGR